MPSRSSAESRVDPAKPRPPPSARDLVEGLATDGYLAELLSDRIDLERIRQDRILHEALISAADPLRLALVFG